MTTQEYIFCEEYFLNGGDANGAAIVAEYPKEDAEDIGKSLLKRKDIQKEISQYGGDLKIDDGVDMGK